jgi:hypothetical protein
MTSVPFRLRVELPNRPGALAVVASAIAAEGGNVVSIDIHDGDGPSVIDEIVALLPEDWSQETLTKSLEETAAATLLSSTSVAVGSDSVVKALRWATTLVRSGAMDDGLELTRAVSELCTSSVAWIATVDEALLIPTGEKALKKGAPVVELVPLPIPLSPDQSEAWLLAVPDDSAFPKRVAFVGRSMGFRFTSSEVLRVEALLHLIREMSLVASL